MSDRRGLKKRCQFQIHDAQPRSSCNCRRLTGIVEEEGVVWLRILDKPVHGAENVRLGRLAHGVLLVICEENHVLTGISEVLVEVCRHVLDIVDTSSQLTLLAEVVNSNQQCLSLSGTARILEVIALRGAVSERYRSCRRGSWATTATTLLVVCYRSDVC